MLFLWKLLIDASCCALANIPEDGGEIHSYIVNAFDLIPDRCLFAGVSLFSKTGVGGGIRESTKTDFPSLRQISWISVC